MNSLHLVSASPTAGTALADCLRLAAPGDALLLLQDGVYAAVAHAAASVALLCDAAANGIALHALLPDVDARGLAGRLYPGLRLVDDNGFVELTERYPRIVSWF